jgi:AcrR family transcriptional regulator
VPSDPNAAGKPTSDPTPQPKTVKGETERGEIVAAAYRVLGRRRGEVSVQDVLTEAGLSTRAFYRHFRSKDELILSMYQTASDRVAKETTDVLAAAKGPADAVEQFVRLQLSIIYEAPRARQAMVLSSPEVRAVAGYAQAERAGREVRSALLANVLDEGRHSGVLPDVTDPRRDALAVLGVIGALFADHFSGGAVPPQDDAVRHITELFLRAFGNRSSV